MAEEAVEIAQQSVLAVWARQEYVQANTGGAPQLRTVEVEQVSFWQARRIPNAGHTFHAEEQLRMRKLVLIGIVLAAVYFGGVESGFIPGRDAGDSGATSAGNADLVLATAFEDRQRDLQVQGSGRVTRLLADDNDGSRHQRFIVQLASGQTVLVAHNIDLASRVAALKTGDVVEFNGEYEWNAQGGVIHWTHRDPQRRHVDGWIRHDGRTYQ